MSYRSLLVLFVAAITTLDVAAQAQPPATPPTYESMIARTWKGLRDKILVMAKDTVFPDGKLVSNYRAVGIIPPISRKAGSQ